ncbi:MAG: DUF3102 domain-containing protein [Rubrivivax sp.]|nr:DUF3102 domain-containing protein [Rubrivivax sp.]
MTATTPHAAAVEVPQEARRLLSLGIEQLPAEINRLVRDAEHHAGQAFGAAVVVGALLRKAKAEVPHGQWEDWITSNTTLAVRTAQAYMLLSKRTSELPAEEAQRVALLPLREAMKAISTPAEAPPRPPTYKPGRHDLNHARPTFEAAVRSLGSVARDVGLRKLSADRIKTLREKLQAVLTELDRMEGGAQ